jgi:hypothetical protein
MSYSKLKLVMFICVAVWLGSAGYVLGTTRTVYPDGHGTYQTIQNAINAAVPGDTVLLADGVFGFWPGNMDISFLGKSITVRSMSGDPETCIIDCQADTADLHRGFNFVSGEGPASVLEGVSIVNGFVPVPSDYFDGLNTYGGGGIRCVNSSPTITNCIIAHNRAESYGGGMMCGGGSPHISNCTFYCNWAIDDGGGLASFSTLIIGNCTFSHNHTRAHGGGMTNMGTNLTLTQCSFSHNTADTYGGGLSLFAVPNGQLMGCTFSGNSSSGSSSAILGQGGAIAIGNSTGLTLQNCTLSNNASNDSGSGLSVTWNSTATLNNTIIAFGKRHEAIYCEQPGSSAFLTCCDVYGNAGGDWVGFIAGQNGMNGNISLDPLFCNRPAEEYGLYSNSPCAPANSSCGLMGAKPLSCIRGDLDSDKDVDLTDFAALAQHWLETLP